MINNFSAIPVITCSFPFGNTPPVSLTQDLPPEHDADILLLGCGDARNLLFTCFVDKERRIDVTCCDIEPGIHARNILLYTLLIDDKMSQNFEQIWNIYYGWKVDKNSLNFLKTQTQKLLQFSNSIDEWHNSVYGSSIRFCDAVSLSSVRSYWKGFIPQRNSSSEKDRQSQMQAAINKAKAFREKRFGQSHTSPRSMIPVINQNAPKDFTEVSKHWWDYGMLQTKNTSAQKPTELNPAFLYSPNQTLMPHYGLCPLQGFPVSTAYAPICKNSAFYVEKHGLSSIDYLINCAKNLFTQWATAFRRAVTNKLVIRLFSGDAIAFCMTLLNYRLTQSTTMSLFCHNGSNSPLILHDSNYGVHNSAPLSFDVIDTSNIADYVGSLNVLVLSSSLLKRHVQSTLYTESINLYDLKIENRPTNFLGVDGHLMSLFLGLVMPNLYTNATNSVEEDIMVIDNLKVLRLVKENKQQVRSRFRWKQSGASSPVKIEAKALAKFLTQIHNTMFRHEYLAWLYKCDALIQTAENYREVNKLRHPPYNRASFAFLVRIIKNNVVTDWNECVRNLHDGILCDNALNLDSLSFAEDLILNMHSFGIDNGRFRKPTSADLSDAILAPVLPVSRDLPEQLCVVIRVRRKHFSIFTELGCDSIVCSFESKDFTHSFSCVKIMFGKWIEKTQNEKNLYPYIEEDITKLSGTSDMFLAVMVPTVMLLQSKQSVPLVKCRLISTLPNIVTYQARLGPELCFSCNDMTSEDVFITQFMPGMSALPTFFSPSNEQCRTDMVSTTAQLSEDGLKLVSLISRITLESEAAKTKLAMKSSVVTIKFKSPLTAIVDVGGSLDFKLDFPMPVSIAKYKYRVARTSSYIEVESPLFDPLTEEDAFFFLPVFLCDNSHMKTVPVPWISTRLDLDAMPLIDFKNLNTIPWLDLHIGQMWSLRELRIREKIENKGCSDVRNYIRTNLKSMIFSFFKLYLGLDGPQISFFGHSKIDSDEKTIIIVPSCFRLDLVNLTVVLDCALIPLTHAFYCDSKATRLLKELNINNFCKTNGTDAQSRAWKAVMPSFVERCRTWRHTAECEYLKTGEIPLPEALNEDHESPICSCGIGKFPTGDYLKNLMERFSGLEYVISRYATRAAISPIFAIPYLEDCSTREELKNKWAEEPAQTQEKCRKCGGSERKNASAQNQFLLICSKCKKAKYCSADCQKADWKAHKPFCKTT